MPSPSQLRRAERDRKAQEEREEKVEQTIIARQQQEQVRIEELAQRHGVTPDTVRNVLQLVNTFGTPASIKPRQKLVTLTKSRR